MKLLFAIKAMDDISGGAERVLADIASGLARRGHNTALLSFDSPGGTPFYPLDEKVRRIALGIGDPKQSAGFGETLARIAALRRTIRAEKPDAVIAFMHSMYVPAALALIGTGIKVIASEHIVPEHYREKPLQYALLILCGLQAERITVLSERVKSLYPKMLQKRMIVMPNPVQPAAVRADSAAAQQGRKIILTIGRLDPQKDQKTLIAAFATLAEKYPDWDVRIIGEGPLRTDLERQIARLGLSDRIFLPGTTKDIDAEYVAAAIFALPSRYEGFGLVTAEAMACGLPALGFADCPGTNELIIDGENGLLAVTDEKTDRAAAFAEKLEQLMQSEELRARLGQKGIATAARFAPDKILDLWEELLKQ